MSVNQSGNLPTPARPPKPPARRRLGDVRSLSARIQTIVDAREHQEFLPAHLEILETPPSPFAVAFTWVICLMFAAAFAWSCFARIDIYAVATGRVQPNGRSKVVQPLATSRVKAILTENGAHVVAGAPLIDLDSTAATADLDAKRAVLTSLEAQIVRYRTTIEVVNSGNPDLPLNLPEDTAASVAAEQRAAMRADITQYFSTRESLLAQLAEKRATKQRFVASVAARERLSAVLKERATMKQTLVAQSAGTRAAVIDAMQQVEQAAADLAYDQGQLGEADAAATSLERRMDQWKSETLAKQNQSLADAVDKRATAMQDVIKSKYDLAQTELTSPIDGTVQQLAVTSIGQVVSAGQPLLVVVPSDGAVDIEALVPNKDIGFVEAGQEAVVKIDAFPFSRYGTIDATVKRVSRDAIDMHDAGASTDAVTLAKGQSINQNAGAPATQDLVFPVTVQMQRSTILSDGRQVTLTPGMTASVEIRTGSRRVIDYLLAPIRETTSTAGHER